jgi:IclR family pca regulon transcriptional regulator
LPSFSTAGGRAILGGFSDAELKVKLAAMKRAALTPQTVTDPKRLLAAVAADRTRGYSLVDREAEPHFRSIAVPVRRYDGAIVAAINIGAHVDRLSTEEMVKRFLPLLREGAEGVRARLL